jgi:hypothetical protein
MIDAEDREILLTWVIRGTVCVIGVFGAAVTLGAAWRLFDLVRG